MVAHARAIAVPHGVIRGGPEDETIQQSGRPGTGLKLYAELVGRVGLEVVDGVLARRGAEFHGDCGWRRGGECILTGTRGERFVVAVVFEQEVAWEAVTRFHVMPVPSGGVGGFGGVVGGGGVGGNVDGAVPGEDDVGVGDGEGNERDHGVGDLEWCKEKIKREIRLKQVINATIAL